MGKAGFREMTEINLIGHSRNREVRHFLLGDTSNERSICDMITIVIDLFSVKFFEVNNR